MQCENMVVMVVFCLPDIGKTFLPNTPMECEIWIYHLLTEKFLCFTICKI